MTKTTLIDELSHKLKLIRAEKNLSQEKMAEILSISKKTLVEIEKGRSSLGWCGAVALATIFDDSEIVNMVFGGDVRETIKSITFEHYEEPPLVKTMGGRIWWRDIERHGGYRIQQNIVSQHFRILTDSDSRVCFSFDEAYIVARFAELTGRSDTAGGSYEE